jgi:hypothetical protein
MITSRPEIAEDVGIGILQPASDFDQAPTVLGGGCSWLNE